MMEKDVTRDNENGVLSVPVSFPTGVPRPVNRQPFGCRSRQSISQQCKNNRQEFIRVHKPVYPCL